jgi:4-hydroxy-tetrahydrodipicolinate reductase
MMAKLDHYSIEMEEIHHTQKLDAPSGTAAQRKVIENSKYTNWT